MTSVGGWIREIGYGVGFLGAAIVGAVLILNAFDQISLDSMSRLVRAVLGMVSLGAAVYFLVAVIQTVRIQSPIQTMGSGGPIWISPEAVRSLVRDILDESFDIDDARIGIRSASEGLRLSIRFSLPADQRIPELAERVQTDVRSGVEERIGVTVDQVDVTAQAFKAASSSASPSEPSDDGPSSQQPPAELGEERDRVD